MTLKKKTAKKKAKKAKDAGGKTSGDTVALEWLLNEMKWRFIAIDLVKKAEAMR